MNISPATTHSYFPVTTHAGPGASEEEVRTQNIPAQDAGFQATQPDSASKNTGTASQGNDREDARTAAPEKSQTAPDGSQLTEEDLRLVEKLKAVDQEVRLHEMAHMAVGGSLVTSGAQFSYKTGPDGQQYAVAGEVGIDTSPVPGDPQATMDKMARIKQAALAPASPSAQDLRVAAKASAAAAQAAGELTMLMAKQKSSRDESQALGSVRQAADAYTRVNSLPEKDNHTFELAV